MFLYVLSLKQLVFLPIVKLKKKKILNKDGSITEKEYLPVHFTLDHRFIDGVLSSKMVKEAKRLFDNPESFTVL